MHSVSGRWAFPMLVNVSHPIFMKITDGVFVLEYFPTLVFHLQLGISADVSQMSLSMLTALTKAGNLNDYLRCPGSHSRNTCFCI